MARPAAATKVHDEIVTAAGRASRQPSAISCQLFHRANAAAMFSSAIPLCRISHAQLLYLETGSQKDLNRYGGRADTIQR